MMNVLRFFWELARSRPFLFLALLLAVQTFAMFGGRALWFSDEVRYAAAFANLLDGHWLVLYLNGSMYPDKPPVYFWFLWLIGQFTGGATPTTFFIGAAASTLAALFAVCLLARRVAEASKDATLLAGLILLSTFYFVGLAQYSRMDVLFTAFILAAQVALYLGVKENARSFLVVLGFVLMGVAALIKGPFGVGLPLLAILVFLAWQGRLRRLFRLDFGFGLFLLVAIVGAWAVGAHLSEGPAYLDNILNKQIYQRAVRSWHHDHPWWHYLATLPLVWLPWTLILLVLPWRRFSVEKLVDLWATRREAGGKAFLWCAFLSQFVLLSAVHTKIVIYALPLFAPAAILVAMAIMDMPEEKSRRFWGLTAVVMGLIALAVPVFEVASPWPIPVGGTGLAFLCLAATAGAVWLARGMDSQLPAFVLALGVTLTLFPVGRLTIPTLDPAMSPKAQAETMGMYASAGFAPAAFNVYPGIYQYYLRPFTPQGLYMETKDEAVLEQFLADNPKAAVVLRTRDFERLRERFATLRPVQEQWIVDRPYVLAIQGGEGPP
ncbi:dolichyl-phosphate-mannose-protein mannosyltransferase family protein [Alkalidesulfovibrio alkalitolerans DSM 16529]|jgi:4-amino-4-deoxy-L-arabinose transferase-like glycosyltransferase|uniref:Dolichyl-phosphate-mannose-protein mannosyltransferase family protein n=1 Tax=Alkalidesulfovibrio alkalitolerans DSM 16529 TaxID=1121439 RepID=S7UR90_9BACT|nr:glycosyltransferase family 39 protein [Alkalidesulfovibrio alkalitolerans]EPR34803.1 dolichyl-phosphate-mannose-protein mannosyltransferase family protein [Alkalidesulfovibrio alkalitolerans DSM 16529]